MGGVNLDLEKTMAEPEYRDSDWNWPAEKFNKKKHSQFYRVVKVFAYDSLNENWGYYYLGRLRDVPTYVTPERPMTRKEREAPFETYDCAKRRKVRLHMFARIEPGIDRLRPKALGKPVIREHTGRVKKMGWNHIRAYRFLVQRYPESMWQNFTFPCDLKVTNIHELPDAFRESDSDDNE